jgi:hypothetical protein
MPIPYSPYTHTLFGNTRVASPFALGDYQGYTGLDPEQYVTVTATGGTVTADATNARIACTVTASSGSRAQFVRARYS